MLATKTWYGGTFLSKNVIRPIVETSRFFCKMDHLNRVVSKYIAEITKDEAGMVTFNSARSVVLAPTTFLLYKLKEK